jgi:O-antigen/teichoic acid export membrane protein
MHRLSAKQTDYGMDSAIGAIARRVPWLDRIDPHLKETVFGAGVAFSLRLTGKALAFGFNVLLARLLGARGAGIYYLALTSVTIAAVVGRMGLDNALLRFTASHAARREWDRVAGAYRRGVRLAVGTSLIVTLLVAANARWIAERIFLEPSLYRPLQLMAVAITPLTLVTLHAEALRGLKKIALSMLVYFDGVGISAASIVLLALFGTRFGVNGAVAAYAGAALIIFLLSVLLWRGVTSHLRGLAGRFDTRLLVATSIPLFIVTSMDIVINMADTVALGIWADSEAVGVYNVARRIALLTSFGLIAINNIVAPKFAELYAQGEIKTLGKLARNAAALTMLLTAPLLFLLILAPAWVLGLFGAEFTTGTTILTILAIGQFINAATGSVGYLLIMTGHEKLMRNNSLGAAVLNILLNVVLVPRLGITGAAIATATSIAAMNLCSAVLVYWKLSIITLPIPGLRNA